MAKIEPLHDAISLLDGYYCWWRDDRYDEEWHDLSEDLVRLLDEAQEELSRVRKTVLQEIKSVKDSPDNQRSSAP